MQLPVLAFIFTYFNTFQAKHFCVGRRCNTRPLFTCIYYWVDATMNWWAALTSTGLKLSVDAKKGAVQPCIGEKTCLEKHCRVATYAFSKLANVLYRYMVTQYRMLTKLTPFLELSFSFKMLVKKFLYHFPMDSYESMCGYVNVT
jgi:hypothetical protein